MPKVAIITTTYKHEKFIQETIDSVLAQTFTDWELLIGDDSPDDATWNIIQRYTREYPEKIRAWHHSLNKGIVSNMNFLLDQTSSDVQYFSFLEGDDVYRPTKIAKCMEIFEKNKNIGCVYTNFSSIGENSSPLPGPEVGYARLPYPNLSETISEDQFFQNFYYGAYPNIMSYSTGMIRRDVLNDIGGKIPNPLQKQHSTISDFDLYFRVMRITQIYGINEPLVLYRSHSSNLSKENGRILRDLNQLIDYYHNNDFIQRNTHYNKAKSKIAILNSSNAIVAGRKTESFRFILKSLRYFPHLLPTLIVRNIIATLLPTRLIRKILNI